MKVIYYFTLLSENMNVYIKLLYSDTEIKKVNEISHIFKPENLSIFAHPSSSNM